jgi:hypothetical protein
MMSMYARLQWLMLSGIALSLLAACNASSVPRSAERTITPPATATVSGAAADSTALYIRTNRGQPSPQIAVVDAASGRRLRDLPDGVLAPDSSAIYATTLITGGGTVRTELNAIDRTSGQTLRTVVLDGAYSFPVITPGGGPAGISADGRKLVLVSTAPTGSQNRLVVLDSSFAEPPQTVDLGGNFLFDALGNGSAGLYLIELQGSAGNRSLNDSYRVRRYDLAKGALDAGAIADKTQLEVMNGMRVAAVASPGGEWLYSLYIGGSDGAFIHALNMSQHFAVCIDLPGRSAADGDFERQLLWSLAITPDGRTLYAANGALGTVAEIDTEGFTARRSKSVAKGIQPGNGLFERVARFFVPAAEAKRLLARGAALSPDQRMLYVVAENGLLAIATGDLSLHGRFLANEALDSVSFGAGGRLYTVAGERGMVRQLDPDSGAVLHELKLAGWPAEILVTERAP